MGARGDAAAMGVILLAAGLFMWPAFEGGYLLTSDAAVHTLWAQQFLKSLLSGVPYPRWTPESNLGAGSVAFTFYPPFVFYSYAPIHLFVKNVPLILLISASMGLAASGLAMYAYLRLFFSRARAAVLAVLYMAMPYHMADLYARSALAEFWAFAWMPLVSYAMHRLRGAPGPKGVALAALAYALLVVTHLPTTLLYSLFLGGLLLARSMAGRDARTLGRGAMALALGIGLSSIYLVPALIEQPLGSMGEIAKIDFYRYANNFIYSDAAGDIEFNLKVSHMSAALGALSIAALAFYMPRPMRGDERGREVFAASLGGALVFFMTTQYSAPLWQALEPVGLGKVQFPWRFLSVASVMGTVALGGLLDAAGRDAGRDMGRGTRALAAAMAGIFVIVSGMLAVGAVRGYQGFHPPKGFSLRADMGYEEMARNYRIYNPVNSYLMEPADYRPASSILPDGLMVIKVPPELDRDFRWAAIEDARAGGAQVLALGAEERTVRVRTLRPTALLFRAFYHPSWKAWVDGEAATVEMEGVSRMVRVPLPVPGEHVVTLKFGPSRAVRAGEAASAASALAIAALSVMPLVRRRN